MANLPVIKRKPFFYDAQLKRMLVQLLAMFSGYQVMTGNQADGKRRFLDVPVIFGDHSNVAATILNGGTESMMVALPAMSLYMTGLRQSAEWRQNPQHTEYYHFIERARDPDGNPIVDQPGFRKTVERYMPVPYEMSFAVSIWSSNLDTLYQLVEQIGVVFNPELDVLLSNSPVDWTWITTVIFDGNVNFERAVPNVGSSTTTNSFITATLNFSTILWMSAPVKKYISRPIYKIEVPILQLENTFDFDAMDQIDGLILQATEDEIIESETRGSSDDAPATNPDDDEPVE